MNPAYRYAADHQEEARRILASQGVPLDDLDDVGQEVLLQLWLARPGPLLDSRAYWWVSVRSAARDYHRRSRRHEARRYVGRDPDARDYLFRSLPAPPSTSNPEAMTLTREMLAAVAAALHWSADVVTRGERRALEECVAGQSVGNRPALLRARRKLRAALRR